MRRAILGALSAIAICAVSTQSSAFCRATTCDPSKKECGRDSQSCLTLGQPLFWASSCLQVYVQSAGSEAQNIDFATTKASLTRAFAAWLSADCGGRTPLLDVQVVGPISCNTAQYNGTQKNANIVLFRDDEWPYPGAEDALAFTHLQFDPNTGELYDSDLEINSFEYQFSTGDPVTANDLDSLLTHEAGHMLGLAHTLVAGATMFAEYQQGTSGQRTLAPDDVAGICAIYPPDRVPSRASCAPRHGFSDVCAAEQPPNSATDEGTDSEPSSATTPIRKGCTVGGASATREHSSQLLLALGLFGVCVRRRRARHQFVSCRQAMRQR